MRRRVASTFRSSRRSFSCMIVLAVLDVLDNVVTRQRQIPDVKILLALLIGGQSGTEVGELPERLGAQRRWRAAARAVCVTRDPL